MPLTGHKEVIDGVEYFPVSTVAKRLGRTYESIRAKVSRLLESGVLKESGDVREIGGTRHISEHGVTILRERCGDSVAVSRDIVRDLEERKEELRRAKEREEDLTRKVKECEAELKRKGDQLIEIFEKLTSATESSKELGARCLFLEDKQSETQKKLEYAEQERDEAEQERDKTREELTEKINEVDELTERAEGAEAELNRALSNIDELSASLSTSWDKEKELQARIEELENRGLFARIFNRKK